MPASPPGLTKFVHVASMMSIGQSVWSSMAGLQVLIIVSNICSSPKVLSAACIVDEHCAEKGSSCSAHGEEQNLMVSPAVVGAVTDEHWSARPVSSVYVHENCIWEPPAIAGPPVVSLSEAKASATLPAWYESTTFSTKSISLGNPIQSFVVKVHRLWYESHRL